jgi:hypothetical protein
MGSQRLSGVKGLKISKLFQHGQQVYARDLAIGPL